MPAITRESLLAEGLEWLLENTFLARLESGDQDAFLRAMCRRSWHRDNIIIPAGKEGPGLELIVEGFAEVRIGSADGRTDIAARVGPGQLLGERSLLKRTLTSAEVRAISPVETLHLAPEAFYILIERSAEIRQIIEQLVALRGRTDLIRELLLREPLLRTLDRDDIGMLLQVGSLRQLKPGERLVSAGDHSDDIFLLIQGHVTVYSPARADGSRELLASQGPGWLFGHIAALLDQPRTADIEASEPSEFMVIPSMAFVSVLRNNPSLERRFYQQIASLDLYHKSSSPSRTRATVLGLTSERSGLGVTTLAFALAQTLTRYHPDVVLIDLEGERSAQRLLIRPEDVVVGEIRTRRLPLANQGIYVCWPADPADLGKLVLELSTRQERPILVALREQGRPEVLDLCETVIHLRRVGQPIHRDRVRRGQALVEVIRITTGTTDQLQAGRNAVRLLDDTSSTARFWRTADSARLVDETTSYGRAASRLGRVVLGRSVGLALGGGGAYGFGHIGLIRALTAANIPIDYIAGCSMGSIIAGLYAASGLPGLDTWIRERHRILLSTLRGGISGRFIPMEIERIIGHRALSSTEIPFFPVSVDLLTGNQVILTRGSVGEGIRASSSLPGPFAAWRRGSWRLADGSLVNMVPASVIWDAGAHFIMASNVIPPASSVARPRSGDSIKDTIYEFALGRMEDVMRSMFLLMSQAGRDRSGLAHYVFDPTLEGFGAFDMGRGDAIAIEAQRQAEQQILAIRSAYDRAVTGRQ